MRGWNAETTAAAETHSGNRRGRSPNGSNTQWDVLLIGDGSCC